ncbi:hypothetical protein Dimus_033538, partial [Dionaea muscipula]
MERTGDDAGVLSGENLDRFPSDVTASIRGPRSEADLGTHREDSASTAERGLTDLLASPEEVVSTQVMLSTVVRGGSDDGVVGSVKRSSGPPLTVVVPSPSTSFDSDLAKLGDDGLSSYAGVESQEGDDLTVTVDSTTVTAGQPSVITNGCSGSSMEVGLVATASMMEVSTELDLVAGRECSEMKVADAGAVFDHLCDDDVDRESGKLLGMSMVKAGRLGVAGDGLTSFYSVSSSMSVHPDAESLDVISGVDSKVPVHSMGFVSPCLLTDVDGSVATMFSVCGDNMAVIGMVSEEGLASSAAREALRPPPTDGRRQPPMSPVEPALVA